MVVAKQWAYTVERALDDLELCKADFIMVRYEDLVKEPTTVMNKVLYHVGLEEREKVLEYARATAKPDRVHAWRETVMPELLSKIRPYMEATMVRLGYEW